MYTYNLFVAHNEVGDSPGIFGYSAEEFHHMMQYRQQHWPHSINGSSTHDTKRGEDVRARLNVISDLHEEWIKLVEQWQKENASLKINGAPDKNDEYFIYQTLAGSHPMIFPSGQLNEEDEKYPERIGEYLMKALREAKIHSNWTEPNKEYEQATINFAKKLIGKNSVFSKTFHPFLKKISDYGMINSFGQMVLKFFCPGIPDVYQGTELWDLSLVDPDNRRPVDYAARMKMLNDNRSLNELWNSRWDGQIKLMLLQRLLSIRNDNHILLTEGEYIPLRAEGEFGNHVIAFLRTYEGNSILVAIPLYFASFHEIPESSMKMPKPDWKDTKIILPPGCSDRWEDCINEKNMIISTQEIMANDLFQRFIVAVFKNQ
jgi:maltooligosyltrehalose synthase